MSDQQISAKEILERIDRILSDTAYLKDAFTTIEKIPQGGDDTEAARLKAEAVEPVSYTHLDVYKRQAIL